MTEGFPVLHPNPTLPAVAAGELIAADQIDTNLVTQQPEIGVDFERESLLGQIACQNEAYERALRAERAGERPFPPSSAVANELLTLSQRLLDLDWAPAAQEVTGPILPAKRARSSSPRVTSQRPKPPAAKPPQPPIRKINDAVIAQLPVAFVGLPEGTGDNPGWYADRLCAQSDPEIFFPEKGGSTREAKRVCQQCEVREECLEDALEREERFGIWGGLSERERRRVGRQRKAS